MAKMNNRLRMTNRQRHENSVEHLLRSDAPLTFRRHELAHVLQQLLGSIRRRALTRERRTKGATRQIPQGADRHRATGVGTPSARVFKLLGEAFEFQADVDLFHHQSLPSALPTAVFT